MSYHRKQFFLYYQELLYMHGNDQNTENPVLPIHLKV